MTTQEKPLYTLKSRVYWSETDAAGIAHFTSFLRYCEKTEEEYILTRLGLNETGNKLPIVFPRVHIECDYKNPLRVHDRYRVDLLTIKIGNKSITWKYKITNETQQKTSAECTIITVAFDPQKWTPIPVPETLRKALQPQTQNNKNPTRQS